MTLMPVTAYTVTCNACSCVLEDDGGGSLFSNPDGMAVTARAYGWTRSE